MLVPDSVKLPEPLLVRELKPLTIPDKVTSALLEIVTLLLKEIALLNVLAPLRFKVVPDSSDTIPLPKLLASEMLKDPSATVIAVDEAWLSPLRTSVPVSTLLKV